MSGGLPAGGEASRAPMTGWRALAWIAAAVGLGLAGHLAVAGLTSLSPDEAYYAAWSHHLAATYLDHPPAVAFVIAAGRALLPGVLGVRLPALLAAALVPVLLAGAAWRLAGPGAGAGAAWLATGTVMLHALGVVVTPDTPLAVTWAGATWLAVDVVLRAEAGTGVGWGRLAALGAVCGLGILSKLPGVVLTASALGGVLWVPSTRRLGARLLALPAAAAVVAAPWIAGTLARPAASDAAFQLAHHLAPQGVPGRWIPAFVGGQAGLLTPVLAFAVARWAGRALRRRAATDRVLLALGLPLFAAFAAVALFRRVEPNWPGPAYLPALVGLAASRPSRRLLRAAAWTSVPVVLAVHLVAVTGLPGVPRDPTTRLRGWSTLAAELKAPCAAVHPAPGVARLAAAGYGLGAEILQVAPACAPVRVLDLGRPSQFDRWPRPAWPARGEILVLAPRGRPPRLPDRCAEVDAPTLLGPSYRPLVLARVRCRPPETVR